MTSRSLHLFIIAIINLSLAACVLLIAPISAYAWCRLTTKSINGECSSRGSPLEWKCPTVDYAVCPRSNPTPPFDEVLDAIDRSFQAWEDAYCDDGKVALQFTRFSDPQTCHKGLERGIDPKERWTPEENLVLFIPNWTELGNDDEAFALTFTYHIPSTGEIVDSDIEINDSGMVGGWPIELSICGENADDCRNTYDIENVLVHEIGHLIGLGDNPVNGSDSSTTMYGSARPGEVKKRTLSKDDVEGVCAIYPAGSPLECEEEQTPTTCACTAPGKAGRDAGFKGWVMFVVVVIFLVIKRTAWHPSIVRKAGAYLENSPLSRYLACFSLSQRFRLPCKHRKKVLLGR